MRVFIRLRFDHFADLSALLPLEICLMCISMIIESSAAAGRSFDEVSRHIVEISTHCDGTYYEKVGFIRKL